MKDENFSRKDYLIKEGPDFVDRELVYHFLSKDSYWSTDMRRDVFDMSINHSDCFNLYCNEQQIGFARVISDRAVFAYLCDVFILPEFRGSGAGKFLLNHISNHKMYATCKRFLLATKDAHGLYRQYGFEEIKDSQKWMEKFRPDAFKLKVAGKS